MEYQLASIVSAYEPLAKSLSVLVFLICELTFVGCVAVALLPRVSRRELSLPELIVPGLFVAVAFAETWSLFGGLTPWANPALLLIFIVLGAIRRQAFGNLFRDVIRNTRWPSVVLLAPCLFFGAMNAVTNGFCYDTLLYHLAAIRWVADFGSVPGLANLHGRLGFNTALHPLAGLFGSPFGIAVGREFVNPAIIVSVCAILLQNIRLNRKAAFLPESIYACLLFPVILGLLFSDCLSSPQPDVSSAGLAILVAWYLREVIQEKATDREASAYLGCLMCAALVVMFKLSYALLGMAAAALATVILLYRRRRVTLIFVGLILAALCSIPWVCRGYVTSGYPLFPSGLGHIHFDWMVPHEAALSEKNWVLSWARLPNHDWRSVLASSDWFRPWLVTAIADPIVWESLLLAAAGSVLALVTGPWRYGKERFFSWCLLISPIILSLFFWFLTAPNPRFAQATLWVAAADIVYLPFICLNRVPRFTAVFFFVTITGFTAFQLAEGLVRLDRQRQHFPNYVGGTAPLVSRLTFSGLVVWVPSEGNLTGPWQIPATPADRFDPRLELRGKTLRDGFRINRSWPKPEMW